jgi:hypothetical protein
MAMTINIKYGTRGGKPFLCRSCSNCIFAQGEGDSEEFMRCWQFDAPIKTKIVECTSYNSRAKTNLRTMQEVAWIIETKRGRVAGFTSPEEFRKKNDGKRPTVVEPDWSTE